MNEEVLISEDYMKNARSGIFIVMKIKLTKPQALAILTSVEKGSIRISGKDLIRILDSNEPKKK